MFTETCMSVCHVINASSQRVCRYLQRNVRESEIAHKTLFGHLYIFEYRYVLVDVCDCMFMSVFMSV